MGTNSYIRRVIPKKIANVQEFGIIDLNLESPYTEEGVVIYRKGDTVNWLKFHFGFDLLNRDDVIIEGPYQYTSIVNPYYLYVHDIPYMYQGRKLTYVFTTEGSVKVYYFWHDDPGTLYNVDMSFVEGWMNTQPLQGCNDIRISKTAFVNLGKHSTYFYPSGTEVISYGKYHIFSVASSYDEIHKEVRFMSNLPSIIYYVDGTRIPIPGTDPFIVTEDRVTEGGHVFHQSYIDVASFIDGTVTYTGYETDLEWITNSIAIVIEAGGFAYILLI